MTTLTQPAAHKVRARPGLLSIVEGTPTGVIAVPAPGGHAPKPLWL